jgi:hypothetical protein
MSTAILEFEAVLLGGSMLFERVLETREALKASLSLLFDSELSLPVIFINVEIGLLELFLLSGLMYMGILSYSYDSIVLFPTGGGNACP